MQSSMIIWVLRIRNCNGVVGQTQVLAREHAEKSHDHHFDSCILKRAYRIDTRPRDGALDVHVALNLLALISHQNILAWRLIELISLSDLQCVEDVDSLATFTIHDDQPSS